MSALGMIGAGGARRGAGGEVYRSEDKEGTALTSGRVGDIIREGSFLGDSISPGGSSGVFCSSGGGTGERMERCCRRASAFFFITALH